MRILGIDYGTKRIGLALSDPEKRMAFPLKVIDNNDVLMKVICDIIEDESVSEIVIGESRDFKGQKNELMSYIEEFVKELKEKTSIPVALEPEVLTSAEARRDQGTLEHVDASAAALITNSYLDRTYNG